MAYSVSKSHISNEFAQKIVTMLNFKPEVNKKYTRYEPDPITFFDVRDGMIDVPFHFAVSELNIKRNEDKVYPTVNIDFTGSLRSHQIGVYDEASKQLDCKDTTTLGLYPGFGKTIVGSKLAAKEKLLTVVFVHRELLTIQWKKTFVDNTTASVWIVGEKYPPTKCDVIICMDTRWHLIPKHIRDQVGFLIIDEAHAFCTRGHVGCLLAFHPKKIVAETATLERDDNMHTMIYAICGSHGVFRESTQPFSVIKLSTFTKPIRTFNRNGSINWTEMVKYTLMDVRRNTIILDFIKLNTTRKILILTSLCDHATLLYDELLKADIPCDFLCGTKRGYIDSTVLVGTVAKIGTGFDPATSCPTYSGKPFDLLLLVCSIKKYSMLVQNVGRVFRSEFPTVVHFVDDDPIYKSHWAKCRKWYTARGCTITDVKMQNPNSTTNTKNTTNWVQSKINQLKSSQQIA